MTPTTADFFDLLTLTLAKSNIYHEFEDHEEIVLRDFILFGCTEENGIEAIVADGLEFPYVFCLLTLIKGIYLNGVGIVFFLQVVIKANSNGSFDYL
jgi:hypothetical protein